MTAPAPRSGVPSPGTHVEDQPSRRRAASRSNSGTGRGLAARRPAGWPRRTKRPAAVSSSGTRAPRPWQRPPRAPRATGARARPRRPAPAGSGGDRAAGPAAGGRRVRTEARAPAAGSGRRPRRASWSRGPDPLGALRQALGDQRRPLRQWFIRRPTARPHREPCGLEIEAVERQARLEAPGVAAGDGLAPAREAPVRSRGIVRVALEPAIRSPSVLARAASSASWSVSTARTLFRPVRPR